MFSWSAIWSNAVTYSVLLGVDGEAEAYYRNIWPCWSNDNYWGRAAVNPSYSSCSSCTWELIISILVLLVCPSDLLFFCSFAAMKPLSVANNELWPCTWFGLKSVSPVRFIWWSGKSSLSSFVVLKFIVGPNLCYLCNFGFFWGAG